jgi:hypothetical protein
MHLDQCTMDRHTSPPEAPTTPRAWRPLPRSLG